MKSTKLTKATLINWLVEFYNDDSQKSEWSSLKLWELEDLVYNTHKEGQEFIEKNRR